MSEQVLSDEEKDALLEGMSSGEVEVQTTTGKQYAAVSAHEIPQRLHLYSNSYPKLARLNEQLAALMSKQAEKLLNTEAEVSADGLEVESFADYCDRGGSLRLITAFSASPLEGAAFVFLEGDSIGRIVETFFGGSRAEASTQNSDFLTPGEISVAKRFCDELLAAIAAVWQPVMEIVPETQGTHQSADAIESIDAGDDIVITSFSIAIGESFQSFSVVWPLQMLAPLLPVFEGQKRDRDAQEDARWHDAISHRVTDSTIGISSRIGATRMTLGEVAGLEPGDIIDLDSPRKSTVYAGDVPIIEGRFGVHDGRYAIETTSWLEPESGPQATIN